MKEKLTVFFNKLAPVFAKLGANKYLQTISAAMMGTLGPIIVGSIAVLLIVFPVAAVPAFLESAGLTPVLRAVNSMTIGGMALYVVFLMSKNIYKKI